MTNNTETVKNEKGIICHQGKWGFYPCSYEDFLKLKELNRHWQKAIRRAGSWKRWTRKEPQNRCCRKRTRNDKGQQIGWTKGDSIPEPKLISAFHEPRENKYSWEDVNVTKKTVDILAEYRKARYPRSSPENVAPLQITSEKIESLLKEIKSEGIN